ncbi:hypothetical protein AAG589_21070 [Isoptericola sp. F-RaC21]|uniref:hypothetical protein n=1 Tax=Isoptericola sp. F-RaC21 TaxID=3141452 RepID=UPI00315BE065
MTAPQQSTVAYYHGGVPRLSAGDFIQPLQVANSFPTQEVAAQKARLGNDPGLLATLDHYDSAVVYLTTKRNIASAFASMYVSRAGVPQPGWVYRVEPDGDLAVDPDFYSFPDVFMTARRARAVRASSRSSDGTS